MQFVALAQALRRESGIAGVGPTAVANQPGMLGNLVAWVNDAYMDILRGQPTWAFLWVSAILPVTALKSVYVPYTDWGIKVGTWDASDFTMYRVSQGVNGRFWPQYKRWDRMADLMRTAIQPGFPQLWSERPDRALVLYPAPSEAMTIEASYYRDPEPMALENTAVPLLPEKYHMLIVWRALMLYAGNDTAPDVRAHAANEYRKMMSDMTRDQLGDWSIAGPLL